jgi:hypothetical protein
VGAIISHINHADTATITNSIGTVIRSLDGMKTPFLRGLARSTGSGTGPGLSLIQFDIDLGEPKSISTIGAIGLNASEDVAGYEAQMLVSLSLTGAGNDEVLSGGEGNWRSEWGLPWGQACWLHADAAPWSARYVRIRLDVDRPAGTFYVDVRRLWIGGGIFIDEGIDNQWSMGIIDASETTTTPRGGFFASEYARRRRLSGALTARAAGDIMGTSDAAIGAFHALAAAGRSREVVVTPRSNADSADKRARHAQTVYGTFSELSPAVDNSGNIFSLESFAVDELPYPALS